MNPSILYLILNAVLNYKFYKMNREETISGSFFYRGHIRRMFGIRSFGTIKTIEGVSDVKRRKKLSSQNHRFGTYR